MRQTVFVLLCVMMIVRLNAQQKPHYTQYILNQYVINPAISGIENYTDVKVSHRHQWVGIQDAPVTTYFTIHGSIGKKDYRTTATSFSIEGENPRGRQYWEDYTAAPAHHGIGFQVIDDRTGPLHNMSAYVTYAYHLGLTTRTSIAGGFGLGFTRVGLDRDKLQFFTAIDPAVYNSGEINKMHPDLNAGIYIYSADYFIGLSAQQVIPQKLEFSDNTVKTTEGKFVPHLFATAGYRFSVGDNFNFLPSVMVKYVQPVPTQVEVNGKLQYLDLAWIGASYRHEDGFAAMMGLNISNVVTVGYSYDYTTSKLNNFSKGTHEIILGFLLGNKYDDSCPRNVW
jgi:type IX secretion system PorP/SprF family membrane protein